MTPSPSPMFDLGWLWETLTGIVDSTVSWFEGLWTTTTELITNTGQGLYAGLMAFGSMIWDAILKAVEIIGEWFYDAFKWIYDGIIYWANIFGRWVFDAFAWIGSGVSWVAQQLYNFGMWLYNGLVFVWNWLVNTLTGLWKGMMDFFGGVAGALASWWGGVTTSINTWWTNLIKSFRSKLRDSILASLTITGAWKGVERLWSAESVKDFGFGIMSLIGSPIAGYLAGSIIDAVIPTPSTGVYPLIPTIEGFEYTPPSIEVMKPLEPMKPQLGVPPRPPYAYVPIVEYALPITLNYDYTWYSKSFGLTMDLSYEWEVMASPKETLAIDLSYETEVAPPQVEEETLAIDLSYETEVV